MTQKKTDRESQKLTDSKGRLDALVDFGPTESNEPVSERLKNLIQQVDDLSRRVNKIKRDPV